MQEGSASPLPVTQAPSRELPLHPAPLAAAAESCISGMKSCACRYIVRLKQGSDAQDVDTLCGDLQSSGTTCTFKYGQVLVGFAAQVSPGSSFPSLSAAACDPLNCSIYVVMLAYAATMLHSIAGQRTTPLLPAAHPSFGRQPTEGQPGGLPCPGQPGRAPAGPGPIVRWGHLHRHWKH